MPLLCVPILQASEIKEKRKERLHMSIAVTYLIWRKRDSFVETPSLQKRQPNTVQLWEHGKQNRASTHASLAVEEVHMPMSIIFVECACFPN